MSKNTRIDNILNLMGLEDRLFEMNKDTALSRLQNETDYCAVEERLSAARNKSKDFLFNSLQK